VLDSGDIIPGVIEDDSIFPTDTIAFPGDTIVYEIDMLSVYEAIRQLCEVYYMGFRLQRDGDTGDIYWDIYTGSDRTSAQTALPAIIFSPRLGNLQNAHSLKSIYMERNVAYVFSPVGYEIVYGFDVDPAVEGFDRRVIFVKADDITDTVPADASDKMIQRGKEALAKSRRIVAFDGQLTDTQNYVYGVDYNLGDLVEQRNDEGLTSVMQITEQIFVQDKEGFRSYPGLTFYQTIIDGEWYSYGPEVEWYDFTTEHWDDLPGG
jgi:hypothetical protein